MKLVDKGDVVLVMRDDGSATAVEKGVYVRTVELMRLVIDHEDEHPQLALRRAELPLYAAYLN